MSLAQVLKPLLNSNGQANSNNAPKQHSNNNNKTRNRNARRRNRAANSGYRSSLPRNPGSRGFPRADNMLALTRDQFTATSPLNLFTIRGGSTPGGIRVNGRELIGGVASSAALTGVFSTLNVIGVNPLAINPGSFPRLAAYVPIYEYYVFHKLSIMFQANQPTTTAGEILMCVDYDPKDLPPANSVSMMRNITSTMANVYSDSSMEMIKSLSRLPKFVCSEGSASDIAQTLQGELYVAAEGVTTAGAAAVGYIVAQYDIEFFTPQ